MKTLGLSRIISMALFCALMGCLLNKSELIGEWQAVAFFENGKRIDTPLEPVYLELSPDGQYVFQSLGLYREKGTYRASGPYLFFTDTSTQPQRAHTVKVIYLSPDTLKIQMSSDTKKEQVLFLAHQR